MDDNSINFMDFVSLLSFYLGYKNLIENKQQSAQTVKILKQNDISAANEKQAAEILEKLYQKFDEQNVILNKILEVVTGANN